MPNLPRTPKTNKYRKSYTQPKTKHAQRRRKLERRRNRKKKKINPVVRKRPSSSPWAASCTASTTTFRSRGAENPSPAFAAFSHPRPKNSRPNVRRHARSSDGRGLSRSTRRAPSNLSSFSGKTYACVMGPRVMVIHRVVAFKTEQTWLSGP